MAHLPAKTQGKVFSNFDWIKLTALGKCFGTDNDEKLIQSGVICFCTNRGQGVVGMPEP